MRSEFLIIEEVLGLRNCLSDAVCSDRVLVFELNLKKKGLVDPSFLIIVTAELPNASSILPICMNRGPNTLVDNLNDTTVFESLI